MLFRARSKGDNLTKAQQLLKAHLTPQQWDEWMKHGYVTFNAHGYTWRYGDNYGLRMIVDGETQSFCFHCMSDYYRERRVPVEDRVLAAILFVKHTAQFPAHIWHYRTHSSGIPTPRGTMTAGLHRAL